MSAKQLALFLLLLAVLALATLVLAQSSADFDLSWHVIAGGGGHSTSAGYVVHGTIGQPAAGPPAAVSADYQLNSGFWYPPHFKLYLPATFKP